MNEARTEPTGRAFGEVWDEQIFPFIHADIAALADRVPVRVLAAFVKKQEKVESRNIKETRRRTTKSTKRSTEAMISLQPN